MDDLRTQLRTKLAFWLQPTDKIFADFDLLRIGSKNSKDRRIFIDNGGSVLFVAHVDTVIPAKFIKKTKKRVYATGLDDRLGCLLAYELGMELGADILLTDDEEKCRSTAYYHICKDYNWVVEFDRAGGDVVYYNKMSTEFLQRLSDYWKIGIGSYSDIADLEIGVCCFNLGIGIRNGHFESCSVNLHMMEQQVIKFRKFYKKYHDTLFVADIDYGKEAYRDKYSDADLANWDNTACEVCGNFEMVEYVHGMLLCESCFLAAMDDYMGYTDDEKIEPKEHELILRNCGENWK